MRRDGAHSSDLSAGRSGTHDLVLGDETYLSGNPVGNCKVLWPSDGHLITFPLSSPPFSLSPEQPCVVFPLQLPLEQSWSGIPCLRCPKSGTQPQRHLG